MRLRSSRRLAPGCGACRNYHAHAQAATIRSVYRAPRAGKMLQTAHQRAAHPLSRRLLGRMDDTQIAPQSSRDTSNKILAASGTTTLCVHNSYTKYAINKNSVQ